MLVFCRETPLTVIDACRVGLHGLSHLLLNLQHPSRASDIGFAGTGFGLAKSSARLVGIVRLEIV